MDDKSLIENYLRGDVEALGELYDRHAQAVYGYLCGMVGPVEAEDVLQDAFIKAGRMLDRYEHRGQFRSWLLVVARTGALDRLRKKSRSAARAFGEGEEENISRPQEDPLHVEVRKEMRNRINLAVAKLPEKQKEIFLMREEAELSFKEISDALDIPLNTALSHMHRALQTLRQELQDMEEMI